MNTIVTTQSVAEKIRLKIIFRIGIGLFFLVAAGLFFWTDQSRGPVPVNDRQLFQSQSLKAIALLRTIDQAIHEPDKTAARNRLAQLLAQRQQTAERLLNSQPQQFFYDALPDQVVANIPEALRGRVERPNTTLTGTLEQYHQDDFVNKTSRLDRYIRDSQGKRTRLMLITEAPLRHGQPITVVGTQLNDTIIVGQINAEATKEPLSEPAVTESSSGMLANENQTVNRTIAIVRFNFTNDRSDPIGETQARAVMFTGTNSVRGYFQEISFGQTNFDGDIFGPYPIDYDNSFCGYFSWTQDAQARAAAAGVDLTGYDHIVYVFPYTSVCGYAGWAEWPGSDAWINGGGNFSVAIVGHELGHALGESHSKTATCYKNGVRVQVSSSCTYEEYGDPFDIMANGNSRHMNSFHKGRHWLLPSNTLTVTTDGTYTLAPIEQLSVGVQTIRIPYPVNDYYYLEYRRPFGYDNFLPSDSVVNGVSIRQGRSYIESVTTKLLDMNPVTPSFIDAALGLNQVFFDYQNNITVTTTAVTSASATVQVQFGSIGCIPAQPTVELSPASQWGMPGQRLLYTAHITNKDNAPCAPQTFRGTLQVPNGWGENVSQALVSISPGMVGTLHFAVTSPSSATDGYYLFTASVYNDNRPADPPVMLNGQYNIAALDTTPPTVSIFTPTDDETVQGTVRFWSMAQDNDWVAGVQYQIDGQNFEAEHPWSPFEVFWDTTLVAEGLHTITATARDRSNNTAISAPVVVTVDNLPPTGGGGSGAPMEIL